MKRLILSTKYLTNYRIFSIIIFYSINNFYTTKLFNIILNLLYPLYYNISFILL